VLLAPSIGPCFPKNSYFSGKKIPKRLTGLRISGERTRKRARVDDRPMQPLDGRRGAPDRKRMAIRSPVGVARSVRAIIVFSCAAESTQCSRFGRLTFDLSDGVQGVNCNDLLGGSRRHWP
jgi:hypothetical protein